MGDHFGMRTAIVTLAKDEDFYAEEWLDYHFRLGVDDIWLFQHDGWRYKGRRFSGLHYCEAGWNCQQRDLLNDWLRIYRKEYDWVLFIDLDEFVCLKNGENDIKTFLNRFDDCNGVCLNWRLFGDSGLSEGENHCVLERFTRCEPGLSIWVKCALHTSRAPEDSWLADVHSLMVGTDIRKTIVVVPKVSNTSKLHCQTQLSLNQCDLSECLSSAYLAHFRVKTHQEYLRRVARNARYWNLSSAKEVEAVERKFNEFNHNEVEELALLNFQRTGRFLLDSK